jgi:hypothetical protein
LLEGLRHGRNAERKSLRYVTAAGAARRRAIATAWTLWPPPLGVASVDLAGVIWGMRPQIASSPSARALRLGLYDYEPPSPVRSGRNSPPPEQRLQVVDDWPAHPAVSAAELDVFEAHFAGLLERLFRAPG